ncbi:hypothetical protein EYZ11_004740 [Aspergillus tanneri]|uniref:Uncharacterized protein n=1 Tax=Aspergillus tanneri TaxID=1220188 RepID=A0A4S3JM33_9EURO|nr:uncharacterized protein ATNIH1004_005927 [Aspergillus tanneri]KAA8647237.1 hypothetical protein ATNIH1004_005927 [Aspergillus tanneri]THC95787.1 hypothetical protein EYZ11_004740 [Aspergillus tanneri]
MSLGPEASQFPGMIRRGIPRLNNLNPRIPPIAGTLPGTGKLAAISHNKLQQESASQSPDLRRCLAHHGIYRKCVKAAQETARERMNACGAEKEERTSTSMVKFRAPVKQDANLYNIGTQITSAVKAIIHRRYHVNASENGPVVSTAQEASNTTSSMKLSRHNASKFILPRRSWSRLDQLVSAG